MTRARRTRPRPEPARSPAAARVPAVRTPPDPVVLALAGAGMLVSGYLAVTAFAATAPAFCTEGSGCDLIQHSQWSRLFGLPVAAWGFLTYALLALLAVLPQSRLRRWQRSFAVAVIGVAVSLYLTGAGLIALQAACGWCLVSLLLISALLVALALRRPPSAPGAAWSQWWLGHGLLAVVLVLALHVYWSGLLAPRPEPRLVALAAHLEATGAKFYGTFWCPNCRQQKALFGGAADDLPYVECQPDGRRGGFAFECVDAEIRAFPTWIIRGRRYEEVLSTEELARRSGFRWQNRESPPPAD
jgi:uncharacterized membrane protein